MIDCNEVEERLVDYLDGELAADAREEIEAHLAACPACQATVGSYRKIRSAYHELPEEDVAPETAERVLALSREALRNAGPRRRLPRGRATWLLALAASVLALLGLSQALGLFGEPNPASDFAAAVREGDALRGAGQNTAAIDQYERALAIDDLRPEAAGVYHRLGDVYLEIGDRDRALERITVLTDRFPGYAHRDQALLLAGRALTASGDVDAAIAALRIYQQEFPTDTVQVEQRIRELSEARDREALQALGYVE